MPSGATIGHRDSTGPFCRGLGGDLVTVASSSAMAGPGSVTVPSLAALRVIAGSQVVGVTTTFALLRVLGGRSVQDDGLGFQERE